MPGKETSPLRDPDFVAELLHHGLVQIRLQAYLGNARAAAELADLLHNIPRLLRRRPPAAAENVMVEWDCLRSDPLGRTLVNYAWARRGE